MLGSCVDLAQYEPLPSTRECRVLHDLPPDAQIIGYIGRFEALGMDKGLSVLIDAVGILKREYQVSPTLVCVGGPMEPVPALVEAGRAAGISVHDLRFVDHVPSSDVPTWIGACDIGVIPSSTRDHFARFSSPLKMFEFMAAGVPLVASDLPAVREVLDHGQNAWLVEPDNPAALARGFALLLADHSTRARLAAPFPDGCRATHLGATRRDHPGALRRRPVGSLRTGRSLELLDPSGEPGVDLQLRQGQLPARNEDRTE